MTSSAVVLAADRSRAGKTVISLGLMRAFRDQGVAVRAGKSGPDYIDPAFHAVATGQASVNLDAWAMDDATLRARAIAQGGDLLLIEGAMGVLDGAANGTGSAADLAAVLQGPIVLILNISHQSASAALAPAGLKALRPNLQLAGVILNGARSVRHAALAREALEATGVRVFGAVSDDPRLVLPERHLGLVQASETGGLDAFLDTAAKIIAESIHLDDLANAANPVPTAEATPRRLPPLGQRIAVARDTAFAFAYPHLLTDWSDQGAEILPFSPLSNQPPDPSADAVFLPGGYPELHAGRLATATEFSTGLRAAAAWGARIYGECGGYMVLGTHLDDAEGNTHPMTGLLPLHTSFADRSRALGYRRLTPLQDAPWTDPLVGHEFHYVTVRSAGPAPSLYSATDAAGAELPDMGLRVGSVSGSFAHVIGPCP